MFDKHHLKEPPPRTSYPSDADVRRLVERTSPMMGRIVLFLVQAGMRQEEAVSLEWSQVSIPRREVRLVET